MSVEWFKEWIDKAYEHLERGKELHQKAEELEKNGKFKEAAYDYYNSGREFFF